jgi:hypothetical protein
MMALQLTHLSGRDTGAALPAAVLSASSSARSKLSNAERL